MKALALALLLSMVVCNICNAQVGGIPAIHGPVTSVNGDHFWVVADGVDVKVFVDANTVYKVGGRLASASVISKDTVVTLSGTSDRVGAMQAQLVEVTPSKDVITGTVKDMKKTYLNMENEKGDKIRVRVSRVSTIAPGLSRE